MYKRQDYAALGSGRRRVFDLMRDGAWHTADEIRRVAQGSEGLRRLRELRRYGYDIQKQRLRAGSRMFIYRLVARGE